MQRDAMRYYGTNMKFESEVGSYRLIYHMRRVKERVMMPFRLHGRRSPLSQRMIVRANATLCAHRQPT
jgi:hypothetical protein